MEKAVKCELGTASTDLGDGLITGALAVRPSHTMGDGDVVFALATGHMGWRSRYSLTDPPGGRDGPGNGAGHR